MNLFTIIKENLNTFSCEFATNSHEWYAAHVISNLDALTNFFASNFLTVASDAEKQLFEIYKEKISHEKEFYKKYYETYKGKQLHGSEVAERLKKLLWSLTQHAKKLDCYSAEEIKEEQNQQLSNNDAVANKIAEIEKNLHELKKILKI